MIGSIVAYDMGPKTVNASDCECIMWLGLAGTRHAHIGRELEGPVIW